MNAKDLLADLARRGITLKAEGDQLRARGKLDDEARALIRTHKPELLALLRPTGATDPTLLLWDCMGGTLWRIDRIDWQAMRAYCTALDPMTPELAPLDRAEAFCLVELMEYCRRGDYQLHLCPPKDYPVARFWAKVQEPQPWSKPNRGAPSP